jgi:uncharacterized protein (DUF2249 family)
MIKDAITQLPNVAVTAAIRAHHDELSAGLRERTAALLAALRAGDPDAARERLHAWYQTELLPHAAAEEHTLYAAGADLDASQLLVEGMLAEHQALIGLVARLALARDPFDVVAAASSAQDLFAVHLAKENDLLLPALERSGVALAPLLEGMHELLGEHGESSAAAAEDGCGCGGCGCGGHADAPEPVAGAVAVPLLDAASASEGSELDVRALPHGQRHEIIFAQLDALQAGQSLTIVNDHDPKPLRYQSEALWPDRFAWTYREAGPQLWRVAITRAG